MSNVMKLIKIDMPYP